MKNDSPKGLGPFDVLKMLESKKKNTKIEIDELKQK
jgi:hypothetical protein